MLQNNAVRRYISYAAYLLAIYVLGWGFTAYKDIFLGLMLGTIVSFLNLIFLYSRVKKVADAAIEGQKVRSFGMIQRFAFVAFAILLVFQFPDVFHLLSTVIGLMTGYVVIVIDSLIDT